MSINIHYVDQAGDEKFAILTGAGDYRRLWQPVVERHGLDLIDVIASAGMPVGPDCADRVICQLEMIRGQFPVHTEEQNRIDRCISLIRQSASGQVKDLYIG